ncbi:MAG: Hpt domain-containing protein, partial [Silvanigrellaceae bacterium]|nr:Hpt domain-containing protein [Silvanigrellaceae bacterium]
MGYSEEQIREIFFQEMFEIFDNIDRSILELEKAPDNLEVIKNLFRDVHTLKGSSGVFGLKEVSDLTHHVENILEKMRVGSIKYSEYLFSAILKCFDRLKQMMFAASQGKPLSDFNNETLIALLENGSFGQSVKNLAENQGIKKILFNHDVHPGELKFRVSIESTDHLFLSGIDPISIILNCKDLSSRNFEVATILNRVPPLDEIEPEKCYFDFVIDFTTHADEKTVHELFQFASMSAKINIIKSGFEKAVQNDLFPYAGGNPSAFGNDVNDFVRLKREKLNQLMNLVGELITVKNLFAHLTNRIEEELPDHEISKGYREGTGQIIRLSTRLQESVMNARLVP